VIRVAVVAEVRVYREALASLLGHDGRLRVAATSPTAEALASTAGVDVLVVDTAGDDGAASLQRAMGTVQSPVVALGAPADEDGVIALAELGVLGFVEREAPLDELVASIVAAAAGEARFPPRVATTLLRRVSALAAYPTSASADSTVLTARERQIVDLIAEGLSNKEIAKRLYIEVATVKNHVHNILEKLNVSRRSDAVERLRLVQPHPRDVNLVRTRAASGSRSR
jgi:two-component system nitrate/nitrite response regulator NarL